MNHEIETTRREIVMNKENIINSVVLFYSNDELTVEKGKQIICV
jgi:hypothetical protein